MIGAVIDERLDLPLILLAEAFGQESEQVDANGAERVAVPDDLPAAMVAAVVLPAEGGPGSAARV